MFIIKSFRKVIFSLVLLVSILEISTTSANILFGKYIEETPIDVSPMAIDKYNHHINPMFNAYREDQEEHMLEANDYVDTQYRTWKRNGDLINSLLALPKDMDEAGR